MSVAEVPELRGILEQSGRHYFLRKAHGLFVKLSISDELASRWVGKPVRVIGERHGRTFVVTAIASARLP